MSVPEQHLKYRIRSFIRRQGRLTPGQQAALDQYWGQYCLNPDVSYDYTQVFGRKAPLFVEIGFGNGESLVQMALANPDQDYLGIEVHKPGVGGLLLQLKRHNINNVRVFYHDAVGILERHIEDNSLSGIFLFFPDPWHKRRHHKRRIVRNEFVQLLSEKLKQGGFFHAATDWENYAQHMLHVLSVNKNFKNNSCDYASRPDYRLLTKFERRGIRLGHGVWDLIFSKQTD